MARSLLTRGVELIRSHAVIFAVLTIWAFGPLVASMVYVIVHGGVLTGANGADAFDQMAYLAWIRDEGTHFFASNLWQIAPTAHDYLHPMYVISGLLWRLGMSVQLAYLVWKPVAVLVLFLGFAAYARQLLPGARGQQAAALFLSLFYLSPLLALASWTGHLSDFHRLQLILATDDAGTALNLWGFEHAAIAIGLMPVFLIAAERLLANRRGDRRRAWIVIGAVAGALVSWLHPWQGLMLLGVAAGLWALHPPRRRYLALAIPVAATLVPLIYGVLLSRSDPVWQTFQSRTIGVSTAPWWALIGSFGPLAVFAALGLRRPREAREWMLTLWLIANVAVYFLIPEFPPHALSGVTLPLSILAVRGWRRVGLRARLPARVALPAAIAAVLTMTVPAAVYHAQQTGDAFGSTISDATQRLLLVLSPDQRAALSYVSRSARPGGVLAPWFLSMSVPAFTGRAAYAGHGMWQPASNVSTDNLFFDPALKDPRGALRRAILHSTAATFVITDCASAPQIGADIAPVARLVRRFGCVSVYETA